MDRTRLIAALPLMLACASAQLLAERARLAEGTPVHVRLKAELATEHVEEGSRVDYVVARPVTINGAVVIPEGAVAWGAVQSVKSKSVRIDIEGVRLPNHTDVKLRTLRDKQKRSGKDEIKVEAHDGGNIAAPAGSEFTGYVDDDVWVDVPASAAAMKLAPTAAPSPGIASAAPAPASVATPAPTRPIETTAPVPVVKTPVPAPSAAVAQSVPASVASSATPAPSVASAAAPVREPAPGSTPTAAPVTSPASAPTAVPVVAAGERITVECFSDPLGADILVDGDFYGNTPSILKLSPGSHRLEYQLAGHALYSQQLNLLPGAGLSTIRATLEKK